jgi:hypothetical protein
MDTDITHLLTAGFAREAGYKKGLADGSNPLFLTAKANVNLFQNAGLQKSGPAYGVLEEKSMHLNLFTWPKTVEKLRTVADDRELVAILAPGTNGPSDVAKSGWFTPTKANSLSSFEEAYLHQVYTGGGRNHEAIIPGLPNPVQSISFGQAPNRLFLTKIDKSQVLLPKPPPPPTPPKPKASADADAAPTSPADIAAAAASSVSKAASKAAASASAAVSAAASSAASSAATSMLGSQSSWTEMANAAMKLISPTKDNLFLPKP